jgi:hypothetical protein
MAVERHAAAPPTPRATALPMLDGGSSARGGQLMRRRRWRLSLRPSRSSALDLLTTHAAGPA